MPSESPPTLTIDDERSNSPMKHDENSIGKASPAAQSDDFDEIIFDWSLYLKSQNVSEKMIAPEENFFQQRQPPVNKFKNGMKLETRDPRAGENTICLATVEATSDQWVKIRLEGCDNSNDHWVMCDDTGLLPVGHANELGMTLAPPIGFKFSIANHQKFVDKMLNGAKVAPSEAFRPISPVLNPKENKFKIGQRLEAVELKPKIFNGTLMPSTITEVDGDFITVNFDGYPLTGVKMPYYSRDIFPCGWGKRANIPVQKPPDMKKRKPRTSRNKLDAVKPKDNAKKEKGSSRSSTPQVLAENSDKQDAPRAKMPRLEPSITKETKDKKQEKEHQMLTVCVNARCACGPYLTHDRLVHYQGQIGPVPIMHGLREAMQSLLNSARLHQSSYVLKKMESALSETFPSRKDLLPCVILTEPSNDGMLAIPAMDEKDAWRLLNLIMYELQSCKKLLTPAETNCVDCCAKTLRDEQENAAPADPTTVTMSLFDEELRRRELVKQALTWTVDEVAQRTSTLNDAQIKDMIIKHEIDGHALFLLTKDLMVTHMGLKLGKALKLEQWIDDYKKSFKLDRRPYQQQNCGTSSSSRAP